MFILICLSDLCGKITQSVRERKSLTNSFNTTKSEIEKLRCSLQDIGNQEYLYQWIDTFGNYISDRRNLPDTQKKILLKKVLDCITVDYDWKEKVHRLNIHFKIPVLTVDREVKYGTNIPDPSEPLRNQPDQPVPVGNYSTVKRTSSSVGGLLTDKSNNISPNTKGYSILLNVQLVSSNLWTSTYSPNQQRIFDIIKRLHEGDGWNFVQISSWLNDKGYLSPRGKVFLENHVWSIYMKKKRSIQRFSREFPHKITDMKVDVVDYVGKG